MKVLIVEDEHKVVDYLRSGLTEQGWVVDVAMDGEEGTHLAIEYDYDVIVLDVMLPRRDGFAVLKALRMQKSTPVIMLTARDHVNDRVRGLREGADDYLTKPFSFLELVERLHALARRTRAQESTLISVGNLYVDLISRRATRDGMRLDLTAKEFQLLSVLARRHGDILSKTAITELVWEVDFESHTNVVETAIKRLRAKLDGPFCTKLLHTVRGIWAMCSKCAKHATRAKPGKTRGHHEHAVGSRANRLTHTACATFDCAASRGDVRARRAARVRAGRLGTVSRAARATGAAFARFARQSHG